MTSRWFRSFVPRSSGKSVACALVTVLAFASNALGHQIWLEPGEKATQLYFGEFGDNLREVSPGVLDKLARPTATLVSARGEQPLEAARSRDNISFSGRAAKGESVVVVDPGYPIREVKEGERLVRTLWTPAARFVGDLSARKAQLTLDVIPTGKAGQFQISFQGKPLAQAEATLTAVSGWSLAETSDAAGLVSFALPWQGSYALLVRHKQAAPGARKTPQGSDEAYDMASFATTLTFVTRSGLASPPAPPPAAPN
jgi:hypothetical protein